VLKQDFNQGWFYGNDDKSEQPHIAVTLPHDAMIHEPRKKDNPSQNNAGFFPGGNYSYTKKIIIPDNWINKYVALEFEGIYNRARVYVNGNFVCSNNYGYTGFYAEMSPYLHSGENSVTVKVTNGDISNSRWYTGSGIYRPVNLIVGGDIRIAKDGLKIRTPEVDREISQIETIIVLEYDGFSTKKVRIRSEICDLQGRVLAFEDSPLTIFKGDKPIIRQHIYLRNPSLWNVDSANLYICNVVIREDDILLDEARTTFGLRHITLDPVFGLRINGEKTLLRGACIHHDNGVVGACSFTRAEERKVELCKKAGFNSIRISHNSASNALLDACDRLGMLVMEESFDTWNHSKTSYDYAQDFAHSWEKDVESIVAKDFNHPSVLMYSIGNEIQELGSPAGDAWNMRIAEKFRLLDSTRPVTNAINSLGTIMDDFAGNLTKLGLVPEQRLQSLNDGTGKEMDINEAMTLMMGGMNSVSAHPMFMEKLEETCSRLDICGYNYMRDAYDLHSKHFPNRIMFGSETLSPDIDLNWKICKENPQVIGDFAWTGWDYIGESGVGVEKNDKSDFFSPFPVYLAYVGDIDITGHRRPISFYREIVFGLRKEPYISVEYPNRSDNTWHRTPWIIPDAVSTWTWYGYEGQVCNVVVFSDADEVEIFINGQSHGRKPVGEENRFKAIFKIPYEPGKIEAVALINGLEISRYELTTADPQVHLEVASDRFVLNADSQDLAYISISLRDKNGILNTAVDRKVLLDVHGSGTLQGFGSADPGSTENFYEFERTTYNGLVLAVIRAGDKEGEIQVTAKSEGCEKVTVVLKVQ